jgi:hypothetical protein
MLLKILKDIKLASTEFRWYLQEFITKERDILANGGNEGENQAAVLITVN